MDSARANLVQAEQKEDKLRKSVKVGDPRILPLFTLLYIIIEAISQYFLSVEFV